MFVRVCFVIALSVQVSLAGSAAAQTRSATPLLDSIVAANARPIVLRNGRVEGPGADLLFAEASRSQFFVIGEEHNVVEIPELTSALFRQLQETAGYHYMALEQDPVTMQMASTAPARGNLDSLVAISRRYPHAFTFVSDQELRMIADVGAASLGHGDPIWGLDQSFGVTHALDLLLATGGRRVPAAVLDLVHIYRDSSALKERVRNLSKYHYMSASKTEDFARLAAAYHPDSGSEAAFILDNLVRSDGIFRAYREARYYDNGYDREELMKQLFMDRYRRAQSADGSPPKVIIKMGHWHVYRGTGPSNLQTLGNFASELARSNGSGAFHVSIHGNNPAGGFRTLKSWPDSLPDPILASRLPTDEWMLVDLRPLRENFGRISRELRGDQRGQFIKLVYGFDAALYIGGMRPATYVLNPGVEY